MGRQLQRLAAPPVLPAAPGSNPTPSSAMPGRPRVITAPPSAGPAVCAHAAHCDSLAVCDTLRDATTLNDPCVSCTRASTQDRRGEAQGAPTAQVDCLPPSALDNSFDGPPLLLSNSILQIYYAPLCSPSPDRLLGESPKLLIGTMRALAVMDTHTYDLVQGYFYSGSGVPRSAAGR